MKLFLYNISETEADPRDVGTGSISPTDALIAPSGVHCDYVLANPSPLIPGRLEGGSQTFTNEGGEQEKEDFTYNCQDFCFS
jgi:type I restriction enzyme M protein